MSDNQILVWTPNFRTTPKSQQKESDFHRFSANTKLRASSSDRIRSVNDQRGHFVSSRQRLTQCFAAKRFYSIKNFRQFKKSCFMNSGFILQVRLVFLDFSFCSIFHPFIILPPFACLCSLGCP